MHVCSRENTRGPEIGLNQCTRSSKRELVIKAGHRVVLCTVYSNFLSSIQQVDESGSSGSGTDKHLKQRSWRDLEKRTSVLRTTL